MYLVEWHIASAQRDGGDIQAEFEKLKRKLLSEEAKVRKGVKNEHASIIRRDVSVCDDPDGGRSVYEMNDTYIELRTPFDEKRGMVTAGALSFLAAPVGVGLPWLFESLVPELLTGHSRSGYILSVTDYVLTLFVATLILSLIVGGFYFGWKYWRLEAFVQRRLLVRFNRKTRKVYVHRPGYAGGVVALDWDDVRPDGIHPGGHEASGMGAPVMLNWWPDRTPHGHFEFVLVGRLARSNSEITRLWEFIRRYMEEGPESVPRPKRLGRFPWPWKSVSAALSLIWPLLSGGSLRWTVPLVVLISPAIAIFATAQWVALLTCWEPVWPKAIRQACEDGAWPWLRDRLIDLGAWAMLAGLVWAVLRGVYGVG